jgi:outer membrane protein assembly factor BamB
MPPLLSIAYRSLVSRAIFMLVAMVCFGSITMRDLDAQTSDQQWNRFRGPNGTGVLETFAGPLPWQEDNVLHRIDLPGSGNSAASVWGTTAYLQVADTSNQTRSLIAIDIDSGRMLWQRASNFPLYSIHKFSSYASSTPCVDETGVYNVWGSPDSLAVEAYRHDGEPLWKRDLGRYVSQHGFGSSPMRAGDYVIVFDSQDAEELPPGVAPGIDRMVALDIKSGEIAWHRALSPTRVCYGVPVIDEVDGKTALLNANTSDGFFGIDVQSGEIIFKSLPFEKRVCCSVTFNDEIIVASEGSGGGGNVVVALDRATGKERYRIDKQASYVPTTLLHNDKLFIWSDAGIVSSVDAYTGKQLATKRIGGNFSASPILLGDKLLNISHEGVITILSGDEKLSELGSMELEQTSRATLSATPNKLLIRTDSQLWIIGIR